MVSFFRAQRSLCTRDYYRNNVTQQYTKRKPSYNNSKGSALGVEVPDEELNINSTKFRPNQSIERTAKHRKFKIVCSRAIWPVHTKAIYYLKCAQKIFKLDLYLHTHQIQIVQVLKPSDHAKRLQFVGETLEMFNDIFFSDEAQFNFNDYVNHQNCRYWSDTHPK